MTRIVFHVIFVSLQGMNPNTFLVRIDVFPELTAEGSLPLQPMPDRPKAQNHSNYLFKMYDEETL